MDRIKIIGNYDLRNEKLVRREILRSVKIKMLKRGFFKWLVEVSVFLFFFSKMYLFKYVSFFFIFFDSYIIIFYLT